MTAASLADPPGAVPTAPGALPLLGHAVPLLRDPVGLLQSIRPLGDIVRLRIGPAQVYVLNSPELVRQVLAADVESYRKGAFYEKFRPYQGDSLFTTDGPGHQRRRRLVLPAFHRERLKSYADVMRDVAAARCSGWTEGRPIDLGSEMYALAAEVVARVLFGGGIGGERIGRIQAWLPVFVRGMGRKVVSPGRWLDRLPLPANRRFDKAHKGLRALVDELVTNHQADTADRGDLLSMLVAARDSEDGGPLSATQLRDEAITFMTAGIETVSTTLTWLHHELAAHAEAESRLFAEVDEVLGGRPAGFDDVAALPYTRSVVRETLRLHSPAWMLMRRPTAPVRLGTADLPAGTELLFSPATLHRDPAFYPHPTEFRPDRSTPSDRTGLGQGRGRCQSQGQDQDQSQSQGQGQGQGRQQDRNRGVGGAPYLPFSTGPYKCLGDHFALTQLTLTVATIAQRWRLTAACDRAPREIAGAALSPDRVVMSPWRRDGRTV